MLAGPPPGPDDAFLVPNAREFAHVHAGYAAPVHLALPTALAAVVTSRNAWASGRRAAEVA